ncbi:troponin I-like isoform X2 [Diabrotica undecimpunctata]|uniref:troponin I-like isoform X2 n=1 Tax=Diabrotica undecimpunctata TaxID=50387 RepID=UPI003B63CF80
MADDEEKKRKQAEIERKRAEVRARMEEASKAKKAKKGFMTPERKKKLRLLLRKKAAEELKKEQERKAAERRRIIEERCGKPKLVDDANEEQLTSICQSYYDRLYKLGGEKYDLEYQVKRKDMEVRRSKRRLLHDVFYRLETIMLHYVFDCLPAKQSY